MQVIQLYAYNTLRNFSYIFYHQKSKEVICVDPYEPDAISRALAEHGLTLTRVWNTHLHHDHVRGNHGVCELTGVQAELPSINSSLDLGDNWSVEVLASPGHTKEHVCFIIKEKKEARILFSGDTLFHAGVGNCKNGGDPHVLYHTFVEMIGSLSDEVVVYPGHDYLLNNISFALSLLPGDEQMQSIKKKHEGLVVGQDAIVTTLGEERQVNPFLRLNDPNLHQAIIDRGISPLESSKDVFLALRKLRDCW